MSSISIQIDAFDVQLGSAILIQMRSDSLCKPVRILADAGVSASGYPRHHVDERLPFAFADFEDDEPVLDLVVGTHYDKDHLNGLVDVVRNQRVGEVWLPPVLNDAAPLRELELFDSAQTLVAHFSGPGGQDRLLAYVDHQIKRCDEAEKLDGQLEQTDSKVAKVIREDRYLLPDEAKDVLGASIDALTKHLIEADGVLSFGGEPLSPPHWDTHDLLDIGRDIRQELTFYYSDGRALNRLVSESPERALSFRRHLAIIRKSSATKAITATWIWAIVEALRAKDPGIPVLEQLVEQGTPKLMVWNDEERRFKTCSQAGFDKCPSTTPKIAVLGPSNELATKHTRVLPVFESAMLGYLSELKSITPSNQLSQVAVLYFGGQQMLICGDAGFVDFKPSSSQPYFESYLDHLRQLNVIQVAHHAGHNAHFYRVLCPWPCQSPCWWPGKVLAVVSR